jgi:hypothetical protein
MSDSGSFIGAYWNARDDSLDVCATSLARFIASIATVSPILTDWRPKAARKALASRAATLKSLDDLHAVLALGASRRDVDEEVIAELGWRCGLWNGRNGEAACSISVRCGCVAESIANSCVLNFARGIPVAFPSVGHATRLIEMMVGAWAPDRVTVTSVSLLDAVGAVVGQDPDPIAGWVDYFSPTFSRAPWWDGLAVETRPLAEGMIVVALDHPPSPEDVEDVRRLAMLSRRMRDSVSRVG